MRGYFYKERIRTLPAVAIILGVFVLWGILSTVFYEELNLPSTTSFVFIFMFIIYRNCAENKKATWEFCSRAFPVSAAKKIGARFISVFVSLTFVFALLSVLSGIAYAVTYNLMDFGVEELKESFGSLIAEYFNVDYLTYHIFEFGLFLLAAGVSVTACLFAKGQTTLTLACMPYIVVLLIITFFPYVVYFADDEGFVDVFASYSFALRSLAAAVLLYIACCFICIARETVFDSGKAKKFLAAAAVVFACGAVLGGTCIYSLDKAGVFEVYFYDEEEYYSWEHEESSQEEYEMEQRANDAIIRPVTLGLIDDLCGKTLVDMPREQVLEFFTENGYAGYLDSVSEDGLLSISCTTYDNSDTPDYPDVISFSASVLEGVIAAEDYDEKLAEIKQSFALGITEEQAVELIKDYGLCPNLVIEGRDVERCYRIYYVDFEIRNEGEEIGWFHTLYFKISDGRIVTARVTT